MVSLTTSIGDLVPTVKLEPGDSRAAEPPSTSQVEEEVDKDVLCPICMQIIKDAFLTACGHNFCYMCILTHLQNKSSCPSCSRFLTPNLLYPNFLLNKLLMKASARQIARTASPLEQLRQALEQGCETSLKELDSLMHLIAQKKSKMEQEQAESNLQILLDFLHCLRKKRLDELNEIKSDLQFIKEDIQAVEMRRMDFYHRRDKYSATLSLPSDEASSRSLYPFPIDKRPSATTLRTPIAPGLSHHLSSAGSQNKKPDVKLYESPSPVEKSPHCLSQMENLTQSQQELARKRRVHMQFGDLQECYLQKRRYWARSSLESRDKDTHASNREGFSQGLQDFQSVLSSFTRYSRLHVVAELRHGDLFHSANIVSSIEFDRDDELFATAGVSRRIKIFDFASVVNEPADAQYPVAEMVTRSKLSCLSWNKSIKNQIASSDYEGIVTVWDAATRQSVMEYEEHEKRAWSVDFSRTEPSMLVSGSDDCKVKVWCTRQEASAINIDMKANICSVKYNPGSSFHIAIGSADHHIHYYDLRNASQPLHIFSGHRKTVSYVKFLSNNELASASTDSTLRLWDVKENMPLRVFKGHKNEKNFVGLTVDKEYIACGSETNEVFVYHKEISKPAAWHRFVNSNSDEGEEDMGSYFISAVCWKSGSPTMLAANSQGTIKVLVLAP